MIRATVRDRKAANPLAGIEKIDGARVRIGFLESGKAGEQHTESELTLVQIASINEFGARITIPARKQQIYRRIAKDGRLLNGGRFVKRSRSNFETDVIIPAHTIMIPERSFLRAGVDENKEAIQRQLQLELKSVAAGKQTPAQALERVGAKIVSLIRLRMQAGIQPPLSAQTIARRAGKGRGAGGDTPLIDTGQLIQGITWDVEGGA
jgi:hypothetical protein